MANIFDYLQWRGDLTLEQDEFNEIDNLILARFSYLPFDELITLLHPSYCNFCELPAFQ